MGEFKTILKKQGGAELLKQGFKKKLLAVAGVELLILGWERKALEILRLILDYKSKKFFEKKYRKRIAEIEKKYDPTIVSEKSNKLWVCWFQGLENAPKIVKLCVQSLKNNLTDREIVLITKENIHEYVNFPQYIIEKWEKGQISNTHMTDLLRLELLLAYGGTWIDATVYCTSKRDEIPDYFFDSELFLMQTLKPGRDGASTFISSWYITSYTNNKVLWVTKELCYEYWQKNNYLVDYFLLHHFLCMVLENCQEEWEKIIPRDNSTPHILLLRLFEKYEQKTYQYVVEQSPFHKLSYKFSKEQKQLSHTFYQYLLSKYEG